MTRLTSNDVLKEQKNGSSGNGESRESFVSSVVLTHKALTDVSCLSGFQNLERLDLSINSLTSVEGLRYCVNLKWLSVMQNKLESLQGIQGLCKLKVLNAGKNKIKSMEQVRSLGSLRALILNDNEIVSIGPLDELKELKTLVLSRNPIREIGYALRKMKSITKLSLSHCQLGEIGSSLKACCDLREARFSHNDIRTLPAELAYNKKLQSLDVGNNVIARWTDVKVLASLSFVKNLNLLGNPISENPKVSEKIRKLLPNLRVFNSKPLEKISNIRDPHSILEPEEDVKRKRTERKSISHDVAVHGEKIEKEVVNASEYAKHEGMKERGNARKKLSDIDVLDDTGASFADIVALGFADDPEKNGRGMNIVDVGNTDAMGSCRVAVESSVRKKAKRNVSNTAMRLPVEELGLGGASKWDD